MVHLHGIELYGNSLVAKEEGCMHFNPVSLTEAQTGPAHYSRSLDIFWDARKVTQARSRAPHCPIDWCDCPLKETIGVSSEFVLTGGPSLSSPISHLLRALCFLGVRHDGEPASKHPQRSSSCCRLYKSELTEELLEFFFCFLLGIFPPKGDKHISREGENTNSKQSREWDLQSVKL